MSRRLCLAAVLLAALALVGARQAAAGSLFDATGTPLVTAYYVDIDDSTINQWHFTGATHDILMPNGVQTVFGTAGTFQMDVYYNPGTSTYTGNLNVTGPGSTPIFSSNNLLQADLSLSGLSLYAFSFAQTGTNGLVAQGSPIVAIVDGWNQKADIMAVPVPSAVWGGATLLAAGALVQWRRRASAA